MTTPSDAGRAGERVIVWHDEADRAAAWGCLDPTDACMCRECVLTIIASDWLAAQIAAAEQRGREDNADHGQCYVFGSKALAAREAAVREDERERIADLDTRCARAEEQLREGQAAHERNGFDTDAVRLSGKREGVALARDYLREILGDRP